MDEDLDNFYVILVSDNETEKYLFNHRMLVSELELAHHFKDLTPAKHYFSKSTFVGKRHQIIQIVKEEPQIDPHNPGAFVE